LTEINVLDVLIRSGIADIVSTDEGTALSEISEKAGMNEEKLLRVMRQLTSMDIFTEVRERVFRLTKVGMQYRRTAVLYPMFASQYSPKHPLLTSFGGKDIGFSLYDALTRPDFAHSHAVNKTAFNIARNTDKGSFEDMFSSANPKRREMFVLAMKGMAVFAAEAVPRSYPWDNLPTDAVVVDVGGGTGHIMMSVLRKFPKLKIVVQDMEAAVTVGKRVHPAKVVLR
jgi:O-methyltransferase domain